jgi:hypothetical protein
VSEITSGWAADWAWSIPLILLTVMIHALGLLLVELYVVQKLEAALFQFKFRIRFPIIISTVVLFVTMLHGAEALVWAGVYRTLGALPDETSAMLYSLSAITSYGHAGLYLLPRWQLMGALEALNGVMLFGLTTAFLLTVVQRASPPNGRSKK